MPTAQEQAQAKVAEAQRALAEAQRQLANMDGGTVDYDVDSLTRGAVLVQSDPNPYLYVFDNRGDDDKVVFMSGNKGNVAAGTVEKGLDPAGGTFIESATMLTKREVIAVVEFAKDLVNSRL